MKTQISTSVPSIIRQKADELVEMQYGTMSALLTALITAEYIKYKESPETMSEYVKATLEMGQGEQRARFINEMNEFEKKEFAKALLRQYKKAGYSKDEALIAIPEMKSYL